MKTLIFQRLSALHVTITPTLRRLLRVGPVSVHAPPSALAAPRASGMAVLRTGRFVLLSAFCALKCE